LIDVPSSNSDGEVEVTLKFIGFSADNAISGGRGPHIYFCGCWRNFAGGIDWFGGDCSLEYELPEEAPVYLDSH
jgi:hypothetical protein